MRFFLPIVVFVLALAGAGVGARAHNLTEVAWQNTATTLLLDSKGAALSSGGAEDGDGAGVQLGYYTKGTSTAPFAGVFVPLTGGASANAAFRTTSIGDSGGGGAGRFSLVSTFVQGAADSGQTLPVEGTPLVVRFFDGKTVGISTLYNEVSAGSKWNWQAPSSIPGSLVCLSLLDSGLVWKGGAASAFRTTLPCGPLFITNPQSLSVDSGSSATFAVEVKGIEPIQYQWFKGSSAIAGAVSASYTVSAVGASQVGDYKAVATNIAGTLTSSVATLLLNTPVGILKQPESVSASAGGSAKLRVSVTGTGHVTYQWRHAGVVLPQATTAELALTALKLTDAGVYDVVVTNRFGSKTSAPAVLSVGGSLGSLVVTQPVNVKTLQGTAATLPIQLAPADATVRSTTYQVFIGTGGVFKNPLPGMSGSVLVNGSLLLPLRALPGSGEYIVRFVRTFAGTAAQFDSVPFRVEAKPWSSLVASYEALLQDDKDALGDHALYWGQVSFDIATTGAVTAKLTYVEAPVVLEGKAKTVRAYLPVTRAA